MSGDNQFSADCQI